MIRILGQVRRQNFGTWIKAQRRRSTALVPTHTAEEDAAIEEILPKTQKEFEELVHEHPRHPLVEFELEQVARRKVLRRQQQQKKRGKETKVVSTDHPADFPENLGRAQ